MDLKEKIERANEEATRRLTSGAPALVDIAPAGEVIPGLQGKAITHSGPPIEWQRMCGAQQGALIGMVLYEGWAETPEAARAMLGRGEVRLEPNHHHQAVGPMAGTISPSAPVWVVENRAFGNRAFCRQVEGRQQFGEYSQEALDGLRRWRDVWAPTMQYLTGHNLLFLGLAMASGKATADPARGVEYSSIVTAMCRNGTDFGIRVSGLGDDWFTAPAPVVEGLYLPGYAASDAGLDMGDSAITETVGWGAFTLGGAPGILPLVGGNFEGALRYTREMRKITTSTHPTYRMPALGFEGTSVGIDIRKVVQTNLTPILDTAIAHREAGHPIIGAGLVRTPMECFTKALRAFGEKYGVRGTAVPAG